MPMHACLFELSHFYFFQFFYLGAQTSLTDANPQRVRIWRVKSSWFMTLMDLQLCWKKGAQLAATALTEHGLFNADEVNFTAIAATGATLLSPFPGQGRPGVKVGLRARAAQ